jgi:hypothetical protein
VGPKTETYVYRGHDSTTVEGGKLRDQIAMYADGRLTDNGKFYKAAHAFIDGMRDEPLQVQIYEKLDPGVWFDKGIFNLIGAKHEADSGRKVYTFYLNPAGNRELAVESDEDHDERMLSAKEKVNAWEHAHGRCTTCKAQIGLHFVVTKGQNTTLLCEKHSRRENRGLLG